MTNKTIIANWKMNGSVELIDQLCPALTEWSKSDPAANAVICPPFPYLNLVKQALFDSDIALGAQDCHEQEAGAYTGNVSADMLVEMGCTHAILGHSERREYHDEVDGLVQAKALAALAKGLVPVICVGESLVDREQGKALAVVAEQAKNSVPTGQKGEIILAYEPIWAIGTGRVPSIDDIAEMHQMLKTAMAEHVGSELAVLYGGSVKAANAAEILATDGVDGALVGGASLKAEEFLGILGAS